MSCGRAFAFWTVAAVTLLTLRVRAQSVISTRSGIVHFLEGTVYLGDQPLESHPGKFSSVPKGGELRTGEGRAEVLLTPGVFVRIGERSAIRMVDNELSHTRVELLAGSAVVDSAEPTSGTSVTLIYGNWDVRFLEPGVYRVDSEPPRLWVLQGRAEVRADTHGTLLVGQGMYVPFRPVLVPEQTIDPPRDALSDWAEGRQQSVSADNAIAANIQDPASIEASNSGVDSFTYFPMLGLPPVGSGLTHSYSPLGLYRPGLNSLYLRPGYQPGFNSLYLPGYTFLPSLPGLRSSSPPRLPSRPYVILPVPSVYPYPLPIRPVSPHPTPVLPVHAPAGSVYSHPTPVLPVHAPVVPVYSHPTPVRPVAPLPAPGHAVPRVGIHGGAHR